MATQKKPVLAGYGILGQSKGYAQGIFFLKNE